MTANKGQRRPTKCFFKLFLNVLNFYSIFVTQQPTTANEGQRRSTKANEGPRKVRRRSTKAHSGQRRPTTANAGQRRSTKAHSGQRRPTKASAGQRRPTAANDGQRRPTQANAGQRRPTQANAGRGTRFSLSNVCFFSRFVPLKLTILYQFYLAGRRPTQADEGPQQPMMANEGQRRPTKTKRGPNDASGVVWAIICFFSNVQFICYFFITSPSTYSCFFSNKPRSEPEPGLGRPWALY